MMQLFPDKFNSEHFGISMANLSIDKNYTSSEFAEELLKTENFKNYDHITLRISCDDKETTNSAIKNGFFICDTLVQWAFMNGQSLLADIEYKVQIRECNETDLPFLKDIARKSFKIDRFHSDKSLNDDLCDSYYEKWIENSFRGFAEKVFVAEYEEKPVGFITAKTYKDDEFGHMVLSAVSSDYRGLGIYTALVHYCAKWMLSSHSELKGILVGTQIDNIAVQRAWAKLGFSPYKNSYVLQLNRK